MPMIDAGGCLLNVSVDGRDGGPTLMLSNPLGTTLQIWEPQMAALTRYFRVIRYDRRGHGKSGTPPGPYSVADFGRDALAILDDLNIARTHWCGLSIGGAVGQWMAANHPGRIDQLVLANTTCHVADPAPYQARIKTVTEKGLDAIADGVMTGWFTEEFRDREPQTVSRVRTMLTSNPVAGYTASCGALIGLDLREALPRIKARTLVMAGRYDASSPLQMAATIRAGIPGASLTILEAAHLSNVETPYGFNEALIGFLTQR
ncbi:3-oxoadipate enol-lactonase 2 OS=Afipia felis OX=1035 GN=catD PE=4 SV=1 [Afipia felis]